MSYPIFIPMPSNGSAGLGGKGIAAYFILVGSFCGVLYYKTKPRYQLKITRSRESQQNVNIEIRSTNFAEMIEMKNKGIECLVEKGYFIKNNRPSSWMSQWTNVCNIEKEQNIDTEQIINDCKECGART